MNAVEHLVPTRVLNPSASEANYKQKQRSYRKTKLKKNQVPDKQGAQISGAQMSSEQIMATNRWRSNGDAQTYPPTPFSHQRQNTAL